jgi:hypothetical protein
MTMAKRGRESGHTQAMARASSEDSKGLPEPAFTVEESAFIEPVSLRYELHT